MAHKILSGATAVGPSNSLPVGQGIINHTVQVNFQHAGTTLVTALVVALQGSTRKPNRDIDTGLITAPALAVGSTAENVANGAFAYRISGTNYTKGAVVAGTALPSGYVVSDVGTGTYGVINVYINAAGTISYGFPAVTQAYTTAALAIAAGDALVTAIEGGSKCYIGKVLLFNNTGADWDSNTDDLTTGGADITNAIFTDSPLDFIDMTTHTFSGAELTAQQALFHVTDAGVDYIRARIVTLTGDGNVDVYYTPTGGN